MSSGQPVVPRPALGTPKEINYLSADATGSLFLGGDFQRRCHPRKVHASRLNDKESENCSSENFQPSVGGARALQTTKEQDSLFPAQFLWIRIIAVTSLFMNK